MPNCIWCGHATITIAPPDERPDWHRQRCTKCQTICFAKLPDRETLDLIYADAWISESENGAIGSSSHLAARHIARWICAHAPPHAKILDYGAGTGMLSRALAKITRISPTAFEPYGPAQNIDGVNWSTDPNGPWTHDKFDVIVLSEVIEHLPDPVVVLSRIGTLLADNGSVAITTPNAGGWKALRQSGRWSEAQNPAHLQLFSQASLSICAQRAGFAAFERDRSIIRYKSNPVQHLLLSAMQCTGFDGGLRGWLRRPA